MRLRRSVGKRVPGSVRQRTSYRRRLRSRIFISFAVFGIGITALFAAATIYMRAQLEDQLFNDTLARQVERFVEFKRANPNPNALFRFPLVEMWIYSPPNFHKIPEQVPKEWMRYETGVYDINGGTADKPTPYKLAVHRAADLWAFMRYDVSRQELSEQRLVASLIGAVLVFALLSLLIGAWLSQRVMHPVSDLAQRLRRFREVGRVTPLAPHFADDEVGELASALDDYSDRLTSLVERDREFNSDVSHELRTPLAVIATTTELLLDSPDISDKLRERLKRIERASNQSAELIEALLLLSRAERSGPIDGETSEVGKVAADVIASQQLQMRNKPVEIRLLQDAPLEVHAPSSVLSVALTNLIGNAVKYTNTGEVVVRVDAGKVTIEDTGEGIKLEDAERLFKRGERGAGVTGSGAGLGLAIVLRLCELYGWHVSLRPRSDATGTIAAIDFGFD